MGDLLAVWWINWRGQFWQCPGQPWPNNPGRLRRKPATSPWCHHPDHQPCVLTYCMQIPCSTSYHLASQGNLPKEKACWSGKHICILTNKHAGIWLESPFRGLLIGVSPKRWLRPWEWTDQVSEPPEGGSDPGLWWIQQEYHPWRSPGRSHSSLSVVTAQKQTGCFVNFYTFSSEDWDSEMTCILQSLDAVHNFHGTRRREHLFHSLAG